MSARLKELAVVVMVLLGFVGAVLLTMKIQADSQAAHEADVKYRQGQALTTDTKPTTPISREDQKALDEIHSAAANATGKDYGR